MNFIDADSGLELIRNSSELRVAVLDKAVPFRDQTARNLPINIKFPKMNSFSDIKILTRSEVNNIYGIYDFTSAYENKFLAYNPETNYNFWKSRKGDSHGLYVSSILAAFHSDDNIENGAVGISDKDNISVIPFQLFGYGTRTVGNIELTMPWEMSSQSTAINLKEILRYIDENNDVLKIDAINISAGWYLSDVDDVSIKPVHDEIISYINKLKQKNIIIIVASGNSHFNLNLEINSVYPAMFSNVIAVGNCDSSNKIYRTSNYGDKVEIFGPGASSDEKLVLNDHSVYRYAKFSGTSMATPHVSRVLALLKGEASYWGIPIIYDELKNILLQGSRIEGGTLTDPLNNTRPVLNLYGSIKYLYDHYISPSLPPQVVAMTIKDVANNNHYYGKYYWKGQDFYSSRNLLFSYRNYDGTGNVDITIGLNKELPNNAAVLLGLYDQNGALISTKTVVNTGQNTLLLNEAFKLAGDSHNSIDYPVYTYQVTLNSSEFQNVYRVAVVNRDFHQNPNVEIDKNMDVSSTKYYYNILRNNSEPQVVDARVTVKGNINDSKSEMSGNELSLYDLKKGKYDLTIVIQDESIERDDLIFAFVKEEKLEELNTTIASYLAGDSVDLKGYIDTLKSQNLAMGVDFNIRNGLGTKWVINGEVNVTPGPQEGSYALFIYVEDTDGKPGLIALGTGDNFNTEKDSHLKYIADDPANVPQHYLLSSTFNIDTTPPTMQGFNLGDLFNNFLAGVGEALVAAFMDNLSSDLNVIIRASSSQTQDEILRIHLKVHNIDQLVRADGDPSLMTIETIEGLPGLDIGYNGSNFTVALDVWELLNNRGLLTDAAQANFSIL